MNEYSGSGVKNKSLKQCFKIFSMENQRGDFLAMCLEQEWFAHKLRGQILAVCLKGILNTLHVIC